MKSTVHFSGIKDELIKALRNAKQEIKVAVAWLTDEDLIRVLSQKSAIGLSVMVVTSDSRENFKNPSKFEELLRHGGQLYIATPKFLHNKFCIVDRNLIINGSYNWTYYARNNEENILIITLDNALKDDNRLLLGFEAKHKYLCTRASIQIQEVTDLDKFRELEKDVPAIQATVDEAEIILRQELEQDVKRSFKESKSLGIGVSDYLLERMHLDGGGVELIKRILFDEMTSGEMKSGFRKLEEPIPHRVDLSLEYLVTRPKYEILFNEDEVRFCKALMEKYQL